MSVTFRYKGFVAAVVLFHFCSLFICKNVLLHNIPRVFLNKFNGLSRNCVTDITLAKCHGHYILCFWQLSGCITNKFALFLLESSVNELWMFVSELSESIG